MVNLRSLTASNSDTSAALTTLAGQLPPGCRPAFVSVFYDASHDDAKVWSFVQQHFPDAAVMGGTSCGGIMTEAGLGGPGSIGMLLVDDPDGNYGTAAIALDGDVADCAEQVLRDALLAADCVDELPELVWIYQAPGSEEAVISGLRRILGERCPIIGGSSADNAVEGQWRQLGPGGAMRHGLVVGVLFPSGGIGFAFQGGYEPTGASGVVTRVGYRTRGDDGAINRTSGREILTIDDEPAAEVYNRWIGGALTDKLQHGGPILTDTTMFPLGVDSGRIEDVPHYMLIHPSLVLRNGGLSTFASVSVGTRVYCMQGNRARLVERAGKVATAAAAALPGGPASLAGALIVYCAGCMLAVGDEMPLVSQTVYESLGGQPFIGCFTFGEQGFMIDRNAHGNLMISAVAFGR